MDFFSRFGDAAEAAGILLLPGSILIGFALLATIWLRKTLWLIWAYFFLLMFSGFYLSFVENAATALRWLIIPLVPITAAYSLRKPGIAVGAIFLSTAITFAWIHRSESIAFGLQFTILMLLFTLPFAAGLMGELRSKERIQTLLAGCLMISSVFVLMAAYSVVLQGGTVGRLAEVNKSTPLLVITAGLMMQLFAWGYLTFQGRGLRERTIRTYCVGAFFVVAFVSVLTSQRTGFFAGLLGLLPFIVRDRKSAVLYPIAALAGGIVIIWIAQQFFPSQFAFVEYRYTEKGLTGRDERWRLAIEHIMSSPLIGYGTGSSRSLDFGMHNAFFSIWYEGGLAAVLLWTFSVFFASFRAIKLFACSDLFIQNIARLALAWIIVNVLSAQFESKLYSPSNVQIFTLIFSFVLIEAGHKLMKEKRKHVLYASTANLQTGRASA